MPRPLDHPEPRMAMTPGGPVQAGDRVRLRPCPAGDIFDLALAGKTALVEAVEEDLEGRRYLAVVVEDDPGRDLGCLRQPGHRFFFLPEEVESLDAGQR